MTSLHLAATFIVIESTSEQRFIEKLKTLFINRDARVRRNLGEIGLKWAKYGTFVDLF